MSKVEERIRKLREEADQLEDQLYKKPSKKLLKELDKEYDALVSGEEYTVKYLPAGLEITYQLSWEDSNEPYLWIKRAQIIDKKYPELQNLLERWDYTYDIIDNTNFLSFVEKQKTFLDFQKKIEAFCDKIERLEEEYGPNFEFKWEMK